MTPPPKPTMAEFLIFLKTPTERRQLRVVAGRLQPMDG